MQYEILHPESNAWIAHNSSSLSDDVANGLLGWDWRIRRAGDWAEFSVLQMAEATAGGGSVSAASAPSGPAPVSRYRDAYRVAEAAVSFGSFIKTVGWILGALNILGGIILASQARNDSGSFVFFTAIFSAVSVIVVCFFFGVIVSAVGQILRATLDTAVHSSPFMDEAEKRQILRLPAA